MDAPLRARSVERASPPSRTLGASGSGAGSPDTEGSGSESSSVEHPDDERADAECSRVANGLADPERATDVAGTITLDETDRHRRRLAMTTDEGLAFVLELEHATLLRDGDRLVLDDGRRVLVRAAPEPLLEVRASDPHHLLRLAWHMGNRHLPTQLMGDHLRIRRDHVIADMLRGLGAEVREVDAGFDPEGGAYGDAGRSSVHRGHEGAHEHDSVQGHGHDHEHEHEHEHAHAHAHGNGHGRGSERGDG